MPFDVDGAEKVYFDASKALQQARDKLKTFEWESVMRNAQICIELSVKGILRLFDIEYPPNHDVSMKLELIPKKIHGLSEHDIQKLARIAMASKVWESVHSIAVYGLLDVSPSNIFKEIDSKTIIESASDANILLNLLINMVRMNQLRIK